MKRKTIHIREDCNVIEGNYHPMRDWIMDPNGYFLIRINKEDSCIELGFCKTGNIIKVLIKGKTPQEIYFTAINQGLLSRLDHAAYLGKELQKAYFALMYNLKYIQDDELKLVE